MKFEFVRWLQILQLSTRRKDIIFYSLSETPYAFSFATHFYASMVWKVLDNVRWDEL